MMYGRSPTEISEGGAVASAIGFASADCVWGGAWRMTLPVSSRMTTRSAMPSRVRSVSRGDTPRPRVAQSRFATPSTTAASPTRRPASRRNAASATAVRTRLQPLLRLLLQTQVGLLDMWALEQALARAFQRDPPVFQDIAPVAELQRAQHVLLDEEDGQPFRIDALEIVEDELDHHGGETQARLVEHEKSWLGHEATADGAHLLLSSRQCARQLPLALGEPGEQLEHPM